MSNYLNADDRNSIACALRVAGEKYFENAKLLRETNTARAEGIERLAEQFDRQYSDAIRLAELLENSESVSVAA